MAAETQYTANTGMVAISTANSNLDGTGTLGTVLTAASNGTKVKSVKIKAVGNTTAQGMVRLFVTGGGNTRLIAEIKIPIITYSAADKCFERYIPLNLDLQSGYILKASTQIGDTFNIFAEGLNWAYNTSTRPESTNYTANTGIGIVSTANSNLDGTTGTVATILTAGASGTYNGCYIKSIKIKGLGSTTVDGMIRLFIQNTGSSVTQLLTEVRVPIVTVSATLKSFEYRISFPGGFNLQPGYKLLATTEKTNSFAIIAEGQDWKYPSGDVLGYNLYAQLASAIVNPADATTYYFGSNIITTLNTTAAISRIYITAAGIIDTCYLFCTAAVAFGSGETSTMSIRLNNSTDTAISSAVVNNAAGTTFSNTGLSIAVAVGDYIEIKWTTPTWATNPGGVCVSAQIHVKTNL
ncbi:MAG: hypothetical protein WAV23_03110 [Minisyncoccia bacterium]